MRVQTWAVLLITCGLCVSAPAQQKKKPARPPEPEVVEDGGARKPSEEMVRLLKWFVGTWTTSEKHEANDVLPNGGTGSGKEVIKAGPGGLTLISDYSSSGSMGKLAGHGIIYWDDGQKAYASFWCDNMNPVCESGGMGKWEEDDLVFRGDVGPKGRRVATVQRYSRIGSDSFLFELMVADAGGEMKKSMTIEYRRAKK